MSNRPDDRPWTEAEWERFFYESDVRAARYGDLLETLHRQPDCQEIIDREMGCDRANWPRDIDDSIPADEFADEESDEGDFPTAEEDDADDGMEELGIGDAEEGSDRRNVPAYAQAFDWAMQVHKQLQPFIELLEDPEPDDPFMVAYARSLIVPTKIVGGHAMNSDGDDDTLCANIVCCRRALTAAEESLAALESLDTSGAVPASVVGPLLEDGHNVRRLIMERIAELRSRVWWE